VEILKQSGFQPIPLAVTDLLTALQTGLVDAFAAPPAAALSFQWFALAPNMADLRWQPLPAATVISLKTWNEIPAALRPQLEKAAFEAGARLQERIHTLNDQAVDVMKQHGLKITHVSAETEARWQAMVREKTGPFFIGPRFSRSMYDAVQAAIEEYRRAAAAKSAGGGTPSAKP
jgi:TRAP-type transport system periplasmic protein